MSEQHHALDVKGNGTGSAEENLTETRRLLLDLRKRVEKNLQLFLDAELELAGTYLDLAEAIANGSHRTRLLQDVQESVVGVHHFEETLADGNARLQIHEKADRLAWRLMAAKVA
jgi:hypothetical protein